MATTKIHWADKVWNPVTGCSKVSSGCENCYAEKMSKRLAGRYGYHKDEPFRVTVHPDRLGEPGEWKKPQRVFVCSMADLFHDDVPIDFILRVFGRMNALRHHTFMLLTKRPENAMEFCFHTGLTPSGFPFPACSTPSGEVWPENVWLGVTAENQEMADKRIPVLLQIPVTVRFVSVEPMLGSVDLERVQWPGKHKVDVLRRGAWNIPGGMSGFTNHSDMNGIDWVICGGESGQKARPMHLEWAESLRDQCKAAGVPFFMKQMSGKIRADRDAIPAHIDIQQFPG